MPLLQAKRTNVGIALVGEPRVLFLDEPTSGLDSYTASEVMQVVQVRSRWQSGDQLQTSPCQTAEQVGTVCCVLPICEHGQGFVIGNMPCLRPPARTKSALGCSRRD